MNSLVIDARMVGHAGIGVYLRSILAHFEDEPFKVSLILPKRSWHAFPELHRFQPIFCNSSIYSVGEQLEIPRLIPKCDLFWSPHFNVPWLPIRAKKRVVTICDLYHLDFSSALKPVERLYSRGFIKKALQTASKVITISEFSKSRLLHHFPKHKDKIAAFPLGPGKTLKTDPLPVAIPSPFFLFVGSVKPHKNLNVLLDAFEQFIEWEKTPFHLVIAGKISGMHNAFDIGEYIGKHSTLAKNIHVLGEVDEETLAWLYQKALAFVFPSFYEGWGLPPLEAMQQGCPVIASSAASIPESCGAAALYFDPKDTERLAMHLSAVALSEQVRQDLIEKGAQQIEALSWERCAKSHIDLFLEECLGK